jgi:Flp pilus assembly protein TadG
MRRRLRGFRRDDRGAAAVEFALIAVPFLLLILGGFEFGRLLWIRNALAETAIAGARCVGLLQSECASDGVLSTTAATGFMAGVAANWSITLPASEITIKTGTSCGGVTGFVAVSITHTTSSALTALVTGQSTMELTESSCFPAAL